jgi:uncharacterized protein (DUF2147 family)
MLNMGQLTTTCLLIGMVFANEPATAAKAETTNIDHAIFGLWASEGSIFRTYFEDDTVKGEIMALREPVYTAEESAEKAGQTRMDDNNPDPTLTTRTIVGLNIFSDYEFKDGQWQGVIYDPESGNTYQSKMKFKSDLLEIRGYIGMPMFGRTAKFKPVASCTEEFEVMLTRIEPADLASNEIPISCD